MRKLLDSIGNTFSSSLQNSTVPPFNKLKHQLSLEDKLILLDGHSIAVLQAKRKKVWGKLHLSHQVIEGTKQRA